MSHSLQPNEPQHARPPCPSSTPGVHPNPCPSSRWCHPTISSSVVPFSSYPQSFPASGSFQMSLALHIRWPKYWNFSFNISPSNEHPGLISFRMDWLDLLAVQGTLKCLLQHHSSKASIFLHSAFSNQSILDYSPVYQSVHSYEGTTRGWEKRHLKGLKEMVFRVQPSLGTVNVFQTRDLINQGDTGKST